MPQQMPETLADGCLALERLDAVARITMNRPESVNAINDAIRHGLPALLQQLDADPSIRVIVLRGAGERGFCAGADLKEKPAAKAPVTA